MEFPDKHSNKKIIPKGWGSECIVHSNANYCVKILHLKDKGECSLHFHKRKEESFLVLEGEVQIELCYNGKEKLLTLSRGESIDISPFMAHRFKALKESTVLEASNEDLEQDDLIILEAGDTQKLEDYALPISNQKFIKWEEKCKAIIGR